MSSLKITRAPPRETLRFSKNKIKLFFLGPVIKCLLLDLLTTVGPPLSDHSECEVLVVNYGTVLLTDLLFGGNLLHAISKVRYESFHVLTERFSYARIQR